MIRHEYEGFPAMGVVIYDVNGFEITEYDFTDIDDPGDATTKFEAVQSEIREYVANVLWPSSTVSRDRGHIDPDGRQAFRINDPFEGDTYRVELLTENKQRLR